MIESNYKVAIYTRVSSDSQVLNGRSLEWQKELLIKYAEDRNYDIIGIYEESGISGESIDNRPQLQRLLKDVELGLVNNILVYKIDRIGRYVMTNSKIANILEKNHCFITTSDFGTFDFSKSTYSFVYNMLSSISQFEVNNLSERVVNGKKKRAQLGLYINSNSVYGYDNRYDEINGTRLLVINDYESFIIKRIYNLYLNGLSMNKIAKQLNDENVACKRGGIWRQSTINQILKNKLYIGKVVYNGKFKTDYFEVEGKHEAIIDTYIFDEVQDLISKREKFKAKKFPNQYSYFSPLLICPVCGCNFKAKQTKTKDKFSIRYYCKNKHCDMNSIKHIEIEKIFESSLNELKLDFDNIDLNKILKDNSYEEVKSILNNLSKKRKEIDEIFNNGNIKVDDYNRQINIIKNKLKLIELQLTNYSKLNIKFDKDIEGLIKNILSNIGDSFAKLNAIDKQNFVNLFVNKINVDNNKLKIIWKYENQCS